MPILPGVGLVSDLTYDEMMAERSNLDTTQKSNVLGLEAAELSNESLRIDNEAKRQALKNQAANSAAATQMTNTFLAKWGDMNDASLELLQQAISGGGDGGGLFGDSQDAINATLGDIRGQIDTFDQEYGGVATAAYDQTLQDLQTRGELTSDLMQMSDPDIEGAVGRAATDVSTQAGISRSDMARDAMGAGIDPSSGKFGALQKKSFLSEARTKVEAMNRARLAEKNRAAEMKTGLLTQVDPSKSAAVGSDINRQKVDLLQLQAGTAGKMADISKAKADTITGVAGAVGEIGKGYGSLGSTMLGLQTAQGTYGGTGGAGTSNVVGTGYNINNRG